MSKHLILSEEDMSTLTVNEFLAGAIEHYRTMRNLAKKEMNILDWGCGRGATVAYLRDHGYSAFGVDIDPEPIRNGRELFWSRGLDADRILRVIDLDCQTSFPDRRFHFIYSEHVLEHIADLELVVAEMRRIIKLDGGGYHQYPASRSIVEPHLSMPLLHWLPKRNVPRLLIRMFLALGQDPDWPELRGLETRKRAETYYEYIVKNTFFRSWREIMNVFEAHGFTVDFVSVDHPRLRQYSMARGLFAIPPVRAIFNWMLINFKVVVLLCNVKYANASNNGISSGGNNVLKRIP